MEKEKPIKYKLKKGVKWGDVKEVFKIAALQCFESYFEEDVKKNKYKNDKEEYNGIKFDSKAEMEFYKYLNRIYKKEYSQDGKWRMSDKGY